MVQDDGELNNNTTHGEVEGNLETWDLAVLGAKGTLWFCEEWNNECLDEWPGKAWTEYKIHIGN
jgi:hypothetical protein